MSFCQSSLKQLISALHVFMQVVAQLAIVTCGWWKMFCGHPPGRRARSIFGCRFSLRPVISHLYLECLFAARATHRHSWVRSKLSWASGCTSAGRLLPAPCWQRDTLPRGWDFRLRSSHGLLAAWIATAATALLVIPQRWAINTV